MRHRPPQKSQGRPPAPARREPEMPRSWRAIAGTHAIREAMKVSKVEALWLRQGFESADDLRDFETLAKKSRVKIEIKSSQVLDRLCSTHQGAIAYASSRPAFDLEAVAAKPKAIVMALDGLEDPHNLGAILRTAWLTGVDALLVPADRAVGLTSTAHKVASGGAEHVPVVEVNQFGPTIERLKEQGFWVFGLSHKAEKGLFEMKYPEKMVWAIGAEDKGLRVTTERLCDELVSIPQRSDAASYNASVAAAIALTETLRQHRHQNL